MTKGQRTAFNMAVVSGGSVLQIILQFLFFAFATSQHGATRDTDPLFFALTVATVVSAVISGSISYVLIPDLVAKFEGGKSEKEAWSLASFVGLVTFLFCAIIAGGIAVAAEPLCGLLHEEKVAGQIAREAYFLQIFCWQIVLLGLISWAQSVLNSRHWFMPAALGAVVGMALQVGIVIALGENRLEWIAWSIVIGSAVSLLFHLVPILPKLGAPISNWVHVGSLLAAYWPLLFGTLLQRIDPLFNLVWASELDEGLVTQFHLASRITAALLLLGASSLALVAFPQLAERYSSDGMQGFAEHFSLCARRLALLIIPIAIGVSCFAVEIVSDLLQDGKFTADDARSVGRLIMTLMGMFVGASAAELVSRGFYVLGDTRTPTVIGASCLIVGLFIKYALFQVIGIWGIALGVSLYFVCTAVILYVALKQRTERNILVGMTGYAAQAVLAAAIACFCCYGIYVLTPGRTWLAGPVGVVVYGAVLLAIGNQEAQAGWNAVRQKLRPGIQ